MATACDLFVIGGGSGGVRAARRAAARGLRVVVAEKSRLGGTCVNIGCVPKKLFYYAASFHDEWKLAAAYGRERAELGGLDWDTLRRNKDAEISRLNRIYRRLLDAAGVRVVEAAARITAAHRVVAGGEEFEASRILLASGGAPARPPLPGAADTAVSDDLFYLPTLPPRVLMVGGGYIALEFASIFAGFGLQSALCYRADLPMRGIDDDIRARLAAGVAAHGVSIHAGSAPVAVENGGKRLRLENGKSIDADLIVFATGRKPATDGLGLGAVGIQPRANGTIPVDESFTTACSHVYAVGDLLSTPALTPVATAEAEVFVRRVIDNDTAAAVDYESLPTAVFSRPSLATAGWDETTARARGADTEVYASSFKPMKSGFAGVTEESYIKLVVEKASGRVLGAQMLGEHAAEIMQGIAVAIKAGATKSDFDGTIGIHPTSAEEFVTLRERLR